jgi:hypothetical protein
MFMSVEDVHVVRKNQKVVSVKKWESSFLWAVALFHYEATLSFGFFLGVLARKSRRGPRVSRDMIGLSMVLKWIPFIWENTRGQTLYPRLC